MSVVLLYIIPCFNHAEWVLSSADNCFFFKLDISAFIAEKDPVLVLLGVLIYLDFFSAFVTVKNFLFSAG